MTVYLSHSDHTIFLFAATHFKDSYSLIPSDCKTIVFNIAYKVFVYVVCATVVIALKWATEGSMLVVFNKIQLIKHYLSRTAKFIGTHYKCSYSKSVLF